ncbi:MAG: DNA alkylation repair protein [Beutenbergiaceae bacterium]
MTAAAQVCAAIRQALAAAAEPGRASGQQAYMKSAMPFLGVRVPQVRNLTKRTLTGIDDPLLLRAAALTLWRQAEYREERYAAAAITGLRPLRARLDLMDVHEEMIRTGAWWDHTDEVAKRVGATLAAHPGLGPQILGWARSSDMWIRRAAIISQLGFRERTDLILLTGVIEPNLADREFFIRKAIGWALRDFARVEPAWVQQYVDGHDLSPLSAREALKHLG